MLSELPYSLKFCVGLVVILSSLHVAATIASAKQESWTVASKSKRCYSHFDTIAAKINENVRYSIRPLDIGLFLLLKIGLPVSLYGSVIIQLFLVNSERYIFVQHSRLRLFKLIKGRSLKVTDFGISRKCRFTAVVPFFNQNLRTFFQDYRVVHKNVALYFCL